jgi:NTP pyrophosphatase (non-canonical NTP hydrolase)
MKDIMYKIERWHIDRNLIKGSSDKDQVLKLIQEVGELSDSVCKDECLLDDIGDILVVLINICKRNFVTLEDCLLAAYQDIKDRKGKMVDGVFVKDAG